jgi:hypothetical protein
MCNRIIEYNILLYYSFLYTKYVIISTHHHEERQLDGASSELCELSFFSFGERKNFSNQNAAANVQLQVLASDQNQLHKKL